MNPFVRTVTDTMGAQALRGNNRGTVSGETNRLRMNHVPSDRFRDKTNRKDCKKGLVSFLFQRKGQRGKTLYQITDMLFLDAVSLFSLSFGLLYLGRNRFDMRRILVGWKIP